MPDARHQISLLAVTLFLLMLAAIAVLPLFSHRFWERNLNKLLVAGVLSVPAAAYLVLAGHQAHLWHTLVFDYVPFVILLGALFAITGGISVTGDIEATPAVNTGFLALGALLASFMGTTGASMLLIRPLLQTNRERTLKVHTVLFFIGIVANCCGVLTPLGDPPLFVLYLRGVPFAWFFQLWPQWLFVNSVLLAVYYFVDTYCHRREPGIALVRDELLITPIRVQGKRNALFLLGVVLSVALLNEQYIELIRANPLAKFIREVAILSMALLSLAVSPRHARERNNFTWGPIEEVAYLFLGIFVTMVPCVLYLEWNAHALGVVSPIQFYYATGSLSSILDNTPTAVTFYSLAVGLGQTAPEMVASVPGVLVEAIAAGAVFFGSLTYIGNGPNFMVKAIAEENGHPHARFLPVHPVLLATRPAARVRAGAVAAALTGVAHEPRALVSSRNAFTARANASGCSRWG